MKMFLLLKEVEDFLTQRQGLRIEAKHVVTKKTLHVINPSGGELLTSVACTGENEIHLAVGLASKAFHSGP
jgi:acyl-CoA reductase-like NAD-dependent aldehyde dehydrogenase